MQLRILIAMLLLGTGMAGAQSDSPATAVPAPPKAVPSLDVSAIDKTADPCTDFYQYSCGNWIKTNPIPSDQVRWARSFDMLRERNQYLLYQELTAAAKPDPGRSALAQKYGDFFAACMNVPLANEKGITALQPTLDAIAAWKDKKQLAALVGGLEAKGLSSAPFDFDVEQDDKDSTKQIVATSQGGLTLPDRDYYLDENKRFADYRTGYVEHMTKIFTLAGDTPEQAASEARNVIAIETALAKGSMSRTELRVPVNVYHIKTIAELEEIAPDFEWTDYIHALPVGSFATLNVQTPGFFAALDEQIKSESLDAWKSYLRWKTIHGVAPYLSSPFDDENFNFFGKVLAGQKEPTPRWKRCTRETDLVLGEAVGQDWVKQNFPPDAKANMDKLVAALEKALGEDIQQLPWMSAETKKAAEAKLDLIRNKIGYPEKWRDYSKLEVKRDDLVGNIERSTYFEDAYNLAKLGKPVDEKEWHMTPPTVNAYYSGSMNDINFPAGILQPPFFDNHADPAVNYGAIGVVIGHEMTHGFDDRGSQYDGHGNRIEWQTPADRKAFTEKTECEVKEYGSFDAAPAMGDTPATKLNGKLTLGENTADNGGIRIAFLALESVLAKQAGDAKEAKIDGLTPQQRFFLSFAQIWCENRTDQSSRQSALTDPHSPGRWRVNGTVQNFDEFGKAFGCTKGQPMYPVNSCRVW
jgi:putative endopeptidase